MARADIHVFGSVHGYGTVAASSGLRANETQELERFQFGEISTSDAIARLESQPTMTVRPLASGRMAISRMLPAGVDDAGRPTIEVVTLVVDARVYEGNLGALEVLTTDASWWRSARANARSGVEYPRGSAPVGQPRDVELLRILDAWMYARQSGSVAILPDSALPELLRFLATLDASDRMSCRWGVGINSLSAPVDIAIMMSGASTHGARPAVRPAQAGQWYVGETEFAQFRASAGGAVWIPTSELIRGASASISSDGAATAAAAGRSASYRGSLYRGSLGQGSWNERQKRAVVGSAIAAVCATAVLALAVLTYLNVSSKRASATAVLAQGESRGGDADRMPARPSRAGKPRASGIGEDIPPPTPEEVPPPQPPTTEVATADSAPPSAPPEGAAGGVEGGAQSTGASGTGQPSSPQPSPQPPSPQPSPQPPSPQPSPQPPSPQPSPQSPSPQPSPQPPSPVSPDGAVEQMSRSDCALQHLNRADELLVEAVELVRKAEKEYNEGKRDKLARESVVRMLSQSLAEKTEPALRHMYIAFTTVRLGTKQFPQALAPSGDELQALAPRWGGCCQRLGWLSQKYIGALNTLVGNDNWFEKNWPRDTLKSWERAWPDNFTAASAGPSCPVMHKNLADGFAKFIIDLVVEKDEHQAETKWMRKVAPNAELTEPGGQ